MGIALIVVIIVYIHKYIRGKLRQRIPKTFEGKTIWITGGSSGIGEELAYKLNDLGAKIIISARN